MFDLVKEVLPGAAVLMLLVVQQAKGPSTWLPAINDALSIAGILGAAAYSLWMFMIRPLRRADKAQREEIARIAQTSHTTIAEVRLLVDTVRSIQADHGVIQRDLGRLETEVKNVTVQLRDENKLRSEQHTETMNELGFIKGQLSMLVNRKEDG